MREIIRKTKWLFMEYVLWCFMRPFLWLCQLELRNYDHLPAKPYIMAFNHVSYLDWLILFPFFNKIKKQQIVFIGKKRLFEHPLFKHFMEYARVICVDQENVNKTFICQVRKSLKEGNILGIFPEGTRSEDGKLLKGQPGITQLAIMNRVPVVPVGLNGFYNILPKGKKFPRINKLVIEIGEPIYLDQYYGKRLTEQEIESLTRLIMTQIGHLTHQEYNF
ncbi:acyltransferase [Desulfosporosinus sp. HMP52]|uniref:lysophospholipid acyltransferase family protein n=1 Tax=Desulfosporosinus sp. HMP52 TaxID=1487923 RepID=UPI00051F8921|nr:lysophospholipid acyltransferase family protein [Desulfosporosinus sp. HMP52]KGK92017.1 acyltransferase [Desulfosporosinus sp. HMP52]